ARFCPRLRRSPPCTPLPCATLFRSRVVTTVRPCDSSHSTSSLDWVDLPEPSPPSNVTNRPGRPCARPGTEGGGALMSLRPSSPRSGEHTPALQSRENLVCRLLPDIK